jgi:flagellar export protein FliJ
MQTKFTSIVKFKKQSVDKIELELMRANNSINEALGKIANLQKKITELHTPKSGTFAKLRGYQEIFTAHINDISDLHKELEHLKMKKNQIEVKLKNAYLDYEKMKHLDDIEREKYLSEKKRLEQEELNEISLMLFNNKK